MRAFVRRHVFFFAGIATFGLFLLIEVMPDPWLTTFVGGTFLAVVRVLIIPLWLMRTLQMMLGMGTWPGILQLAVALPLLFAPYVLLDWIVARSRAFRSRATAA